MNQKTNRYVGKDYPRKEGKARVTGRELYPSDIQLFDMMYGKVLRSPHPHAKIKSIDFSEAEKLGAVCISFKDTPKKVYNIRQVSIPRNTYKDWQVFSDHMRQVGDFYGAVAAETEELAARAAAAVKVEWEVLPAYMDIESAMAAKDNLIHDKVYLEDREIKIENNIACVREVSEGEVDKGFKEADVILEREFETPRVYHSQLETKSCVCRPEPDGGITVWPTTQALHNTRILMGNIFDIPLNKVNVVRVAGGGHFGSGIHTNQVHLITAALAMKARRPVKIIQTREEDFYSHCRYPSKYSLKLGVKKDGTITAGEMKLMVDIGSHHIQALAYLGVCSGWWHSLYRLGSMRYEGTAVYTNKAPTCAMQGYGAPQVTFGVETMMDIIAEEINMDPIELRLKNYVGLGEIFWGQGPTIRSMIHSDGVKELLETGAEYINWKERPDPKSQTGRYRRGIGMARGFHTSGTGAPVPGEVKDYTTVQVKVNEDGSIDVLTALMDHGGGTLDAAAKLVAEEFSVPFEKIGISPADTRSTGYDVCTPRDPRCVLRRRSGTGSGQGGKEGPFRVCRQDPQRPHRFPKNQNRRRDPRGAYLRGRNAGEGHFDCRNRYNSHELRLGDRHSGEEHSKGELPACLHHLLRGGRGGHLHRDGPYSEGGSRKRCRGGNKSDFGQRTAPRWFLPRRRDGPLRGYPLRQRIGKASQQRAAHGLQDARCL